METLKIKDFKILNEDFISWVEKNHECGQGFGQDHHSSEGTPAYAVLKLHEENWIQHAGHTFQAVSIDYTSNEVYLQLEYENALELAADDGWGKGFSI